jgi:hypothetical protein
LKCTSAKDSFHLIYATIYFGKKNYFQSPVFAPQQVEFSGGLESFGGGQSLGSLE